MSRRAVAEGCEGNDRGEERAESARSVELKGGGGRVGRRRARREAAGATEALL
jgi:hypothetical protein